MSCSKSMAFAMLLVAGATAAQPAAQPAAPTAPALSVTAGANCPKPDPHPGRISTDSARRNWSREAQAWTICMKKYVAEIQSQADEAVKTANAAVARSKAAVDEYNATVKELQAQVDAVTN